MKIGVLADIHGNKTALEAVMEDCNKKGIEKYILLGDLFAKGSDPEGVFSIVKNLDVIASVRGNTDEWFIKSTLTKRQKAFVDYALVLMSEQAVEYIKQMKSSYNTSLSGRDILMIHNYEQSKKNDSMDIIFTGHTHIAVSEIRENIRIYNPGSVGNPYDSNNYASYGVLDFENTFDFQIMKIQYDIKKEISISLERNIPYLKQYLCSIEYGYKITQ